ncbi:MAG: hypothetical protein BYD32DRAFT_120264 [Podila humilis]|nr:MAG: hypothetical protein BYD32DRAFT_120264 [Podila humilis]
MLLFFVNALCMPSLLSLPTPGHVPMSLSSVHALCVPSFLSPITPWHVPMSLASVHALRIQSFFSRYPFLARPHAPCLLSCILFFCYLRPGT